MISFWNAVLAFSLAVTLLVATQTAPAQTVPPDAAWHIFDTENFRVTFPPELEPLARRAAVRAERAHAILSEHFLPPPSGRIELVVTNHMDFSNGLASPFPRNRIVAYALPPSAESTLAFHDDWLELLILHELVHIFHLDHADGVWPWLRQVFGRSPVLFPNVFNPGWMVEGLATYFESGYTETGRARGAIFDMILRTAILNDDFFSIDRATLNPASWPGGTTRYVYGSLFIDHLARRYGPTALSDLIRDSGGRLVPYRLDASGRAVFGTSLTRAWAEWEDELRAVYTATADSLQALGLTEPAILTTEGRIAQHPRYSPDGSTIAFSESTGRADPALRLIRADGSIQTVARRSSGGPPAWIGKTGSLLYTDLDYVDPYRIYSDLRMVQPGSRPQWLTSQARILYADPHPEGDRAIAVVNADGTTALAIVELDTGAIYSFVEPDLDVYWSGPRWSPDGEAITVSRWSREGRYDIVVLDAEGHIVREVATHRGVDASPTWSPDGRYILFTSDRTGIFNLFAYDLEDDRLWQVTNLITGAFEPDISPDGRWIVFSLYQSDGYYIARIPFNPDEWRAVPGSSNDRTPGRSSVAMESAPFSEAEGTASLPVIVGDSASNGSLTRRYSAWPSILPTSWYLPLVSTDVGFGVGIGLWGEDVVERHRWEASVSSYPTEGRAEGRAMYRFRGWGVPVLDLSIDQRWQVESNGGTHQDGSHIPDLLRRNREAAASVSFLRPSWRTTFRFDAGIDLRDVDFVWRDEGFEAFPGSRHFPLDLGGSAAATLSTVRAFELSLGPQEGVLGSLRLQARRFLDPPEWAPDHQTYWRGTSRALGFRGFDWFGFARSVFAARIDGGIEGTSGAPGFALGGASGEALPLDIALLGRSVGYPVRGFPAGTQRGNRVVSGSAEFRFPLLLVERGFGLLPIGVDRLWGDMFVDAGAAWCPSSCFATTTRTPASPDPLVSVGAEAILQLRLGYVADLPLRAGVAFPLRGPEIGAAVGYLRIGRAF